MNAPERGPAWWAVIEAEGKALDTFLETLERQVDRGDFTWDDAKAAIQSHMPFGIEVEEALDEWIEELA